MPRIFQNKYPRNGLALATQPRLSWLYVSLSVLLVFFLLQIALGTDIKVLILALLTLLGGFLVLNSGGIYNTASLVGFMFLFNTMFFGVVLKTLLGQPLQSNLYAPFTSYLIVFIVSLEVLIAVKFAQVMPVGKPLFQPRNDLRFLKYLAVVCYSSGLLFWILSQLYLIDPRAVYQSEEKSFGGFATIYPIFFMGIVAATAYVLISSKKQKSLNKWVVLMLLTGTLMGLVESRKLILGLTFAYYFLTCFFYRRKITVRQIVVGGVLVLFVFFIFGPIVHIYRNELWFLPFDQRMDYLLNNAGKIFQSDYLIDYFLLALKRGNASYHYQYFGYNLLFIDRFATIQHNDIIIDSFLQRNEMGLPILARGFDSVLASFIYPNKSLISLEDQITWELGLRTYGVIGFPTVPLIACSFAATRWIGIAFIPLLIFILLLLGLKKIGPSIQENVFTIFFLVPILLDAHQWSYSQYIVRIFRIFPVQAILLFVFVLIYQKVWGRRRPPRADVVP